MVGFFTLKKMLFLQREKTIVQCQITSCIKTRKRMILFNCDTTVYPALTPTVTVGN